jgi:hypothetical protein
VLKSPRQVRNAIAYVLLNARRHAAKRIAKLRKAGMKNLAPLGRAKGADFYSSGRWFEGWRAGLPARATTQPPVAEPRTWLLSKGWRLHGLIDPSEVPAPSRLRSGSLYSALPRSAAITSRTASTQRSRSSFTIA